MFNVHLTNNKVQFFIDSVKFVVVQEIDPLFATKDANLYYGIVEDGFISYKN